MKALVLTASLLGLGGIAAAQEPACRTGAQAMADAYILANPVYMSFFSVTLEQYVADNRAHFVEGADAIRCAAAVARAVLVESFQLYDPTEQQRRDWVDAQMAEMGLPQSGQSHDPPSASTQLYMLSEQLSRLTRTLPAAAVGDWGPFQTPQNDADVLYNIARQMLPAMLQQNPELRDQLAPLIQQSVQLEQTALLRLAGRLAANQ